MSYQLTQDPDQVVRLSDGATIPNALNGDWQLYEAWLADDRNTPLAADSRPPVERVVDARRLRKALSRLGLLEQINNAIAAIGGEAQIDWDLATEINQNYSLVLQLAATFDLDIPTIFDLALELT